MCVRVHLSVCSRRCVCVSQCVSMLCAGVCVGVRAGLYVCLCTHVCISVHVCYQCARVCVAVTASEDSRPWLVSSWDADFPGGQAPLSPPQAVSAPLSSKSLCHFSCGVRVGHLARQL